mmetsp:Transcript_42230/g.64736  ORF Transcript_42230/g.64736 Transcript_42230/m.64736 type:complete len:80 (-) Transcript_42230:618-857(-)|eukprot:CAMPEP_0170480910 /NCGR_PEP_ID=MMETSP0208-20121228/1560_1 /TAXON_ID=197538 /ORGANISM="Strombidium inclinatum, Strain S3" /LENGTH=79 /DNA_ID=CAMNT_0010753527 /DNA_START=17 /DNA_END=256 /DNA_ORIENTATION=-
MSTSALTPVHLNMECEQVLAQISTENHSSPSDDASQGFQSRPKDGASGRSKNPRLKPLKITIAHEVEDELEKPEPSSTC